MQPDVLDAPAGTSGRLLPGSGVKCSKQRQYLPALQLTEMADENGLQGLHSTAHVSTPFEAHASPRCYVVAHTRHQGTKCRQIKAQKSRTTPETIKRSWTRIKRRRKLKVAT